MRFDATEKLVRVKYLPECESTNTELAQLTANTPQLASLLLVTGVQTAGRGRQGRSWQTPANQTLACSYYVPQQICNRLDPSWLPLIAGASLAAAARTHLPVTLKWPNDILVADSRAVIDEVSRARGGAKLAGVLCEVSPVGGVIIGTGINLFNSGSGLPAGAISFAACQQLGLGELSPQPQLQDLTLCTEPGLTFADSLLAAYVSRLQEYVQLAQTQPARLRTVISAQVDTLGQQVRVLYPDGTSVVGTACALTAHGQLELADPTGGKIVVAAADVEHLRLI